MKRKAKQKFKPLSEATPEEKYKALQLGTYWVTNEVDGHTDCGPFSEAYLGEPARLYFPKRAYEQLIDPGSKWKWKEGTKLSTLVINIIRSDMAHHLRNYINDDSPIVVPASHMEDNQRDEECEESNSALEINPEDRRNGFMVQSEMEMLEDLERYETFRERGLKIARAAAKESGDVMLQKYVEAAFSLPDYRAITKKLKITQADAKELEARLISIFTAKR